MALSAVAICRKAYSAFIASHLGQSSQFVLTPEPTVERLYINARIDRERLPLDICLMIAEVDPLPHAFL